MTIAQRRLKTELDAYVPMSTTSIPIEMARIIVDRLDAPERCERGSRAWGFEVDVGSIHKPYCELTVHDGEECYLRAEHAHANKVAAALLGLIPQIIVIAA